MSEILRKVCCLLSVLVLFGGLSSAEAEKSHKDDSAATSTTVVNNAMAAPQASLPLLDHEKAWLTEHTTIRVAVDGYFPPYSFLNEAGQYEGIAVDIFHLLEQRLGVTFLPFQQPVWADLYAAAQKREVDVVATMGNRPERQKWFAFTKPYIFKSLIIMTRKETTDIAKPADLTGKKVAMVKGYQYVNDLLTKYPAITPLYVDTMLDGLNGVAVGKADAAITFLGAGQYLKNEYHLANLKFAAVYGRDRFTESIAVRGDWPELATILDKALDSITADEMAEINRRWLGPEEGLGIPYRTIFTYLVLIIGGVLVLIFGFVTWNRALRKQVDRKTAELQQELAERLKAEEALRISEELFRHYFEQANLGFALTSPQKGWLRVNPYLRDMFGYTEEELFTKTWAEMTYPEDLEADEREFNKVLSGEIEHYERDKRFYRKDGKLVPTHLTVSCSRKLDGSVSFIIATLEDISDRKQAEAQLSKAFQQRQALETIINKSPAIVFLWRATEGWPVEYVSANVSQLGYTAEEFLAGLSYADLIHPDDLERVGAEVLEFSASGVAEFRQEYRLITKSGDILWTEDITWVQRNDAGEITHYQGIVLDVSERKKAAEEIKRINEELRAVNRIITTCASTLDAQEILNKVMDEALLITGLEGGTICSVTPEQTLHIAAHRETSQATIEDLTNHAIKVGDCLCGECARDHKPLILHDRAAVLKFSTREVTRAEDIRFHAAFPLISGKRCLGVLCVFTRTDTKPTAQSLKLLETVSSQLAMAIDNAQLYAESIHQAGALEEKVEARTTELDEARRALLNLVEDLNSSNAKLQELDQLKSMFIASMSHELRTPLNSVIGFSSILLNKWQGPLNEEQEKNLAIILRAGKHLLALINDVIDISKIEAGALPTELESFALEGLLSEAVESVLPDAQNKGLTIELHNCPAEMHTDRRRLLQCILNLLSNAVKFSHQGSIIVTAQCNGEVVITVTDPGIGIRAEDLPTLFQAFVRLNPTGQATYPGTGLGLYLTRKLVTEILGGNVGATSEEGKGSSFSITIPKHIAGDEQGGS